MASKTKLVQIRLPPPLHEQLANLANIEHRSKTSQALIMLEEAIADRFSELRKKGAAAQGGQ